MKTKRHIRRKKTKKGGSKESDIEIVKKNGLALQTVEHKEDRDVVLTAVKQNGMALDFAGPWKDDEEIVSSAVEKNGMALQFASKRLKNTKKVTSLAVNSNPYAFQFASDELKDDEPYVRELSKLIAVVLYFASERLRSDEDIIFGSLSVFYGSLEYATEALTNNKAFMLRCVEKNGRHLQFASDELKDDKELVLVAVNNRGDAIQFASADLRSDPQIIQLASAKDPTAVRYALPPLPSLSRQISRGTTDQDEEGVCGYHAFSKIILKNIFELLHPLYVTKEYTYHRCNKFLNTTTTKKNIPHLNKNCSKDGYLKILLFLHLFFLYKTYIVTVEGRPAGWLECNQTSVIYPHLYKTSTIPGIDELQQQDLTDVLTAMKDLSTIMNIHLITIRFKPTLELIKKITNEQLYIMLRIEDSKSERQHAAHFVVIVGTEKEEILFKNSWGDERIFRCILGVPFSLGPYIYDTTTDCVVVLPVEGGKDETITDMSLLDHYLVRYRKLKRKLLTMP